MNWVIFYLVSYVIRLDTFVFQSKFTHSSVVWQGAKPSVKKFDYDMVSGISLVSGTMPYSNQALAMNSRLETVVFGGGCFWCVEAVFESLKGVISAESGYSGDSKETANYHAVSSGTTQHVEVIRVTFDPAIISYEDILIVFFHTHDPTTLNRQGADRGKQYRSVIFTQNEKEQQSAQSVVKRIENKKVWDKPIVTTIEPLKDFYLAEDYHQNYFNSNKSQPYCQLVIAPKLKKLRTEFADKLKDS